MLTIGDNAYQLHSLKQGEITIPTESISYISWVYDGETSQLPDKAFIYLKTGEMLEIWREEARPLYSLIRWGHP